MPGSLVAPVTAQAVLDTRSGIGATTGKIGSGGVRHAAVAGKAGIPSVGVAAVVANVAVMSPTKATRVTVWPSGDSPPPIATVFSPSGGAIARGVTVGLGTGGGVDVYNASGATHVVITVTGWIGEGQGYSRVNGTLLDTRNGVGGPTGKVGAASKRTVTVVGRADIPATGVAAAVVGVVAVSPTKATEVTAWPTGVSRPKVATLFCSSGRTAAGGAIVPVGSNGKIQLYNRTGTTHLVVTVTGWIAAGPSYTASAAKLLDTRSGVGTTQGRVGTGKTRTVTVIGHAGIPVTGVAAVVVNIVAVAPDAATAVTAWPAGTTRPNLATLHARKNQSTANGAVLKLGTGGKLKLRNSSGSTHLVLAVTGWIPKRAGAKTTMTLLPGTELAGGDDVDAFDTDTGSGVSTLHLLPSATPPAVGGHLVVMPGSGAPQGYLGTVQSVSTSSSGSLVTAVPALLDDAFSSFDSTFQGDSAPTGGSSASAGAVTAMRQPQPRAASAPAFATGWGVQFFKSGNTSCRSTSTNTPIDANVSLGMQDTNVDWDFSLSQQRIRFVLQATPTVSFHYAVEGGVSCSVKFPTGIKWFLPGTPLFIDVGTKITFTVSASAGIEASASAPLTLGFEYADGDSTNLSSADFNGNANMTTPEDKVSASITPAATLGLALFGSVGVEASFGMKAKASRDVDVDPCLRVTLAPSIGFSVKFDAWVHTWTFTVATFEGTPVTLFSTNEDCPGVTDGMWSGPLHIDYTFHYGAQLQDGNATVDLVLHKQAYNNPDNPHFGQAASATGQMYYHSELFGPDCIVTTAGAFSDTWSLSIDREWSGTSPSWPWTVRLWGNAPGVTNSGCGNDPSTTDFWEVVDMSGDHNGTNSITQCENAISQGFTEQFGDANANTSSGDVMYERHDGPPYDIDETCHVTWQLTRLPDADEDGFPDPPPGG